MLLGSFNVVEFISRPLPGFMLVQVDGGLRLGWLADRDTTVRWRL